MHRPIFTNLTVVENPRPFPAGRPAEYLLNKTGRICLKFTVTAAIILMVFAGCASVSRYTRGAVPTKSSPEPSWTVLSPAEAVKEYNSTAAVHIVGVLAAINEISTPAAGFEITVRDANFGYNEVYPKTVFRLVTWKEDLPDLKVGEKINVVMSRRYPRELTVSDSRGPAVRAFAGEIYPPDDGINPIHLSSSRETAYFEVLQSQFLCNQTWMHPKVAATSDKSRVTFSPGESAMITGNYNGRETRWRILSADSRFMDESSCDESPPPKAFFVWIRTAILGDAKNVIFQKIRK